MSGSLALMLHLVKSGQELLLTNLLCTQHHEINFLDNHFMFLSQILGSEHIDSDSISYPACAMCLIHTHPVYIGILAIASKCLSVDWILTVSI